jgi:restriction system protein
MILLPCLKDKIRHYFPSSIGIIIQTIANNGFEVIMMGWIVFLQFIVIGLLLWYIKKQNEKEAYLIAQEINSGMDLKRTMAMGLAYRYNSTRNDRDGITDLFLKQTNYDFEDFTAEIMRNNFGGTVFVTPKTGDFGVDFEHERVDGLFLGQAKAQDTNLGFEAIALIHSNMVKRGAKGGYVITTADFTPAAREYAEGLNIQLINGVDLVSLWLDTMDSKVYEPAGEFA